MLFTKRTQKYFVLSSLLACLISPLSTLAEQAIQITQKDETNSSTLKPDVNAQLVFAYKLHQNDEHEKAFAIYEQLLLQEPDNADIYVQRSILLLKLKQNEQAVADLKKAAQLRPKFAIAWGKLGWLLLLQNELPAAQIASSKAQALEPGNYAWTVNLAHSYLLQGQVETAQLWYQKTIPLIPDEKSLLSGPMADFVLFAARGWQTQQVAQIQIWFAEQSKAPLARKTKLDKLIQQIQVLSQTAKTAEEALSLIPQAITLTEQEYGSESVQSRRYFDRLARLCYSMGRYAQAEPLFLRALNISEKANGADHPSTGTSLNNLAELYRTMGRYAEAEPLYLRALAISEKASGAEHPETGTLLNNLALLYQTMGRYAEAETLYLRALNISEKTNGADHPSTGTSLNNLAELYRTTGRYAEAEPLYLRALSILEKTNGSESPKAVITLYNLAGLYRSMKRYTETESLYLCALSITEKIDGSEHPNTGARLDDLADLYTLMKQYSKAESLYLRSLTISEKAYGTEHSNSIKNLNNLAGFYREMKLYSQAEAMYLRALNISVKTDGSEHPSTVRYLDNLAFLYTLMDRYDKAEPLYLRALTISENAYGTELSKIDRLDNLGRLYGRMHSYDKAETMYLRALSIAEKKYGTEHLNTGRCLTNLGMYYRSYMGQYLKAEPLLLRALDISEKINGPEHRDTSSALDNLALVYSAMGQYSKAESLYLRVLSITENNYGAEHLHTWYSLNSLVRTYQGMGEYAKVELFALRALAISEKNNGFEHDDTLDSVKNLLTHYQTMGQFAKAESLALRLRSIVEKDNNENHPGLLKSLEGLADLYIAMGQFTKVEPLLLRWLAVYEKLYGVGSSAFISKLYSLIDCYYAKGKYVQAESTSLRAISIADKIFGVDQNESLRARLTLALLYISMGQYSRAEPIIIHTLDISEKNYGDVSMITNGYRLHLANLYLSMGEYTKAEPLLLHTLDVSKKNGETTIINIYIQTALASLYKETRRYYEAEYLYSTALDTSVNILGTQHYSTGGILNKLAVLYQNMGKYTQAEKHLLRAWQIANINHIPEQNWTVLINLCFIYTTTHPDLAIWFGKQAVNTLQTVRAANTGLDKETQKSFLQKNEGIYKRLAELLFSRGRLPEGQQVLAMLKETEYFDFIQRNAETDPRKSRSELTGQERFINQRYEAIQASQVSLAEEYRALLARQKGWKEADKIRYQKLDEDLAVASTRFTQLVTQLKQELSKQSSHSDERLLEIGGKNLDALYSFKDTLKKLGHGAVTLHYLSTDQHLWILLTTTNTQLARKVVISNTELNTLIAQYRNAIAERSHEVNKLGKQLYDLVVAPIADDLRQAHAQTLMLSLDGALRYLPMAALFDGQQYLAESYRLAIFTEVAKDKIKDPSNPNWHFAGFGLTHSIGGFGALPGVKSEFEGMTKQGLPGSYLLDEAFTADAFKLGLIQSPPVVHVASHFKFQPGNETNSFLLLGDGNKLSLDALKNGNYQFTDVDLLTLSACETAVGGGKEENGREIEGFGVLAQNQGAKSVLATLWQINDLSTGQFMQMFYHIRQSNPGMTKAEALQQTQQAFIKGQVVLEAKLNPQRVDAAAKGKITTEHPYYWAPFILMGNWL